ncbi:MAG: hypothetical protein E5X41_14840 [Mesorhizobium sp.]|nr:MAG: hypothetical protein E5X41_14840 [Mesorhizobium sp.]
MRHGNPQADPRIKKAKREAAAAQSNLRRVVRKVQAECSHPVVAHRDWKSSEYFSSTPAARICTSCGFEEYTAYGTTTNWSGARVTRCGDHISYSGHKLAKKPIIPTNDINRYRP